MMNNIEFVNITKMLGSSVQAAHILEISVNDLKKYQNGIKKIPKKVEKTTRGVHDQLKHINDPQSISEFTRPDDSFS